MTFPTPATQMVRMASYGQHGSAVHREMRANVGYVPSRRRADARRLPDVLRKMMNNIQNKGAY